MRGLTWYGHLSGPSSVVYVSKSIIRELRAAGFEVTAVDLRNPGPEIASGVELAKHGLAPTPPEAEGLAIVHGLPEWVSVVPRHEKLYSYCWIELDEAPPHWPGILNELEGILTPSSYGKRVLEANGITAPITVLPHGIDKAFVPSGERKESEGFKFLHFAVIPDRKGTYELLQAWASVSEELHKARLTLVTSCGDLWERAKAGGEYGPIDLMTEGWRSPEGQAELYRSHHVVVQPSRAECFGLIGLEALACGVPVIATEGTGHEEWTRTISRGLVRVPTGRPAFCKPGPGSAPTVAVGHLRVALLKAFYEYDKLRREALNASSVLQEQWSWPKVLGSLFDLLRREL